MTKRVPPFFYKNHLATQSFIENCESGFALEIKRAADFILQSDSKVFGLAGPTCSGKTTTAAMLKQSVANNGKKLHIISTDDFYLERDYLIAHSKCDDGHIDFDSIETINLEALKKCLDGINAGGSVDIPIFDFKTGKAIEKRTLKAGVNDIFLLEGIHAITPEVASLMPAESYTGIYIDVLPCCRANESGICADGRTVRLARRILRDFRFRSASPEFTLSLWKNVINGEKNGLEPYKDACKIKINSYLAYELSILKNPIGELISDISPDSVYFSYRNALERMLEGISPLGEELVPEGSVYREFIG